MRLLPQRLATCSGIFDNNAHTVLAIIIGKIAENEYSNLGDISTLADPSVVKNLVDTRLIR